MQVELKRLQKRLGITFVYVTHDQEEALTMSDRIAVMREGVVDQLGTPSDIYDYPRTRFVAGFIGESNLFEGTVEQIQERVMTVRTEAGSLLVQGEGFAVDERIHVSIRPEYVEFAKEPVEGFDIQGRIKDFIYMGTVVKTAVDLKSGQEIKYSRFEQDQSVQSGDIVYLSWKPSRAVAIKRGTEVEERYEEEK
jgi:spermidine/putrescine transport system ATP-binding protein